MLPARPPITPRNRFGVFQVNSGIPASFLKDSLVESGITPEMWASTAKIDLGKELDTEAKAWKTVWSAGQGVTTIDDTIPTAELIDRLKSEMRDAIEAQAQLLDRY